MALPKGLGVAVEKAQRMTILHPKTNLPLVHKATGEAAWIDLYSSDSEIARKHQRALTNERLSSKRLRNAMISAEEIEANGNGTLAVVTHAWSLCTLDGDAIDDFPCTFDNAKALYSAPEMAWLRAQVDEFVSDIANFAKGSSEN